MCPDEMFSFSATACKTIHDALFPGGATVIYGYGKAFAFHIQRQVLAHHGKPDQSYICFHFLFVLFYVE